MDKTVKFIVERLGFKKQKLNPNDELAEFSRVWKFLLEVFDPYETSERKVKMTKMFL